MALQFTKFNQKHGSGMKCRKIPNEKIKLYKDKLPENILLEWNNSGWCGYSDGLIWIVDPCNFHNILEDWIGESQSSFVFARTSFGDMFVWQESSVWHLSPMYNEHFRITSMIEILFEVTLCSDEYLTDALNMELHKKAVDRLGILNYDECYAFEPAIALGGSGTLDNIRVVKLLEHLNFLYQLT